MITTILFDLDGTLLPMDQEMFVNHYLQNLTRVMAQFGYQPKPLLQSIQTGMYAMIKNDGSVTNRTAFWRAAAGILGEEAMKDEPLFENFYRNEFQQTQAVCGFNPQAGEAVRELKNQGFRLILATNPLFPPVATHSRVRWAGLEPEDFEFITTYDNASYCKPNPDYYREILGKLDLKAEQCLMVGNDVEEDMVAQTLGMKVFLLTDCLLNRKNRDISQYPQGSFPELLTYIRSLSL